MITWMREKLYGSRQKFVNIWTRRLDASLRSTEDIEKDKEDKMFVSDSNLFSNSDSVKLTILSVEGDCWTLDAATVCTVEKLKMMAVCHFYNPLEYSKTAPIYKLVLVSGKRVLENDNSLMQEGLKDNDEILLVELRPSPSKELLTEENLRGPAIEEINLATQHLEEKNKVKLHPPIECSADFQSEIRKILISLVEASARLLTPSQGAQEVFDIIRERMEAKSKAQPDPRAIRQLMDMGFTEEISARALRLNRRISSASSLNHHQRRPHQGDPVDILLIMEESLPLKHVPENYKMNRSEALEWLLEHAEESGGEVRATSSTCRPVLEAAAAVPSPVKPPVTGCSSQCKGKIAQAKEPESVAKTVAALLESFREYKRQDFKPNERALKNLMDMGFEEKDIRDALRITGNNQSAACEWLLGERRPSLEDLDTGLDPEGPIYKAIMANPAIQLSLTNPKMLLAFLSMLENPSSANMWINDPDASPVLSQIFKTYHAEKHALQMNRYVEQQQVWHSNTARQS